MSDACSGCSSSGSGCSPDSCGVNPQDAKIKKTLGRIKHKFVVMSGKGGVGKSTVATNIAVALSMAGQKVGLLDVDVHGPSIPRMLSLGDEKPHMEKDYMEPVFWSKNLAVMSLGFLLPSNKDAVIWRGPVKTGLIRQFISDVAWGDLDYLILDCPPGTGDEPLSALQEIGTDAQAIVVTTPQGVAVDDVRRSLTFCEQVGNKVFGLVENMSGFACSNCGHVNNIFNSGGGEALAKEMNVRFLGSIPLDPEVTRSGDEGFPLMKLDEHNATAEAIGRIIKPILDNAGKLQEQPAGTTVSAPTLAEGETKIAVPVAQGQLCMHFGHCEQFAVMTVNNDTKSITATEMLTPPAHEPGVFPRWVAEQGATLVIAGGMGSRAQTLFTDEGVTVVTGATSGAPEDVVNAYLKGELVVGQNICDH